MRQTGLDIGLWASFGQQKSDLPFLALHHFVDLTVFLDDLIVMVPCDLWSRCACYLDDKLDLFSLLSFDVIDSGDKFRCYQFLFLDLWHLSYLFCWYVGDLNDSLLLGDFFTWVTMKKDSNTILVYIIFFILQFNLSSGSKERVQLYAFLTGQFSKQIWNPIAHAEIVGWPWFHCGHAKSQ